MMCSGIFFVLIFDFQAQESESVSSGEGKLIAPALRTVYNGQSVFGDKVMDKLPVLMQPKTEFDFAGYGISDKEREIIELVAKGFSNKEIAAELFLGEGTVRNYLSTLLEKLSLRDRTQLAIFYYTEIKK